MDRSPSASYGALSCAQLALSGSELVAQGREWPSRSSRTGCSKLPAGACCCCMFSPLAACRGVVSTAGQPPSSSP
eukprot:13366253-Alexandrium_andersonii.AAC.1